MTVRVLLADDQDLVRAGFRMILETQPDVEVVGEAGDGVEAVAATRRLRPEVVLMDIRMPNLDGLQATRQIATAGSGSRVVILTTFDLDEYVYQALAAGASGFLLKNAPPEQLIRAVRVVAAGDACCPPRSPAGSSSSSLFSHRPAPPTPSRG
jgi:DNA-binding NarL/FixJ family response regulator